MFSCCFRPSAAGAESFDANLQSTDPANGHHQTAAGAAGFAKRAGPGRPVSSSFPRERARGDAAARGAGGCPPRRASLPGDSRIPSESGARSSSGTGASSALVTPRVLSAGSLRRLMLSGRSDGSSGGGAAPAGGGAGAGGESSSHEGMLRMVTLLQELMLISAGSQRPPLSSAMALLCGHLGVDWISLHAVAPGGHMAMQVAAALSVDAQRPRGDPNCTPPPGGPSNPNTTPGGRASRAGSIGSLGSSFTTTREAAGPAHVLALGASLPVDVLGRSGDGSGGRGEAGGAAATSLETVIATGRPLTHQIPAVAGACSGEAPAAPPPPPQVGGGACAVTGAPPADWDSLYRERDLKSFLSVPVLSASGAGPGGHGAAGCASLVGILSFGSLARCNWSSFWWMPSTQLLCGWAAGALPQSHASARVALLDALRRCESLEEVAACVVYGLPQVLADSRHEEMMEARLALVDTHLSRAVIFTDIPGDALRGGGTAGGGAGGVGGGVGGAWSVGPGVASGGAGAPRPPRAGAAAGRVPSGLILSSSRDNSDGGLASPGASAAGGGGAQMLSSDEQHTAIIYDAASRRVCRWPVSTANTVLLAALEWGEVMTVKDTVQYFGRSGAALASRSAGAHGDPGAGGARGGAAMSYGGYGGAGRGGGAVAAAAAAGITHATGGCGADLFLPGRKAVRGTLVLLPMVFRCRAVGCVYLLAPWDIHSAVGRVALSEMAALLSGVLLPLLVRDPGPQREWYALLCGSPLAAVAGSEAPAASAELGAGALLEPTAAAAAAAAGEPAERHQVGQGAQRVLLQSSLSGSLGSLDTPLAGNHGQQEQHHEQQQQQQQQQQQAAGAPAAAGGHHHHHHPHQGVTTISSSLSSSINSNPGGGAPPPGAAAAAATAAPAAGGPGGGGGNPGGGFDPGGGGPAASAAAAAAALAPPGPPVSGYSTVRDMAWWPELLDISEEIWKGRHTAVYRCSWLSAPLAVKVYRYSSSASSLHQAGSPSGPGPCLPFSPVLGGGAGGGGAGAGAADAEAAVAGLYRLCSMRNPYVIQHLAIFPYVYEVFPRQAGPSHLARCCGATEPAFLSAAQPRKDRCNRCCAVVTEFCAGGTLRDAIARGDLAVGADGCGAGGCGPPARRSGGAPPAAAAVAAAMVAAAAAAAAAGARPAAPQLSFVPDVRRIRAVLLQVAQGLHFLHSQGFVHGEVHAENIMLTGSLVDGGSGARASGAAPAAAAPKQQLGCTESSGSAGSGNGGSGGGAGRAQVQSASALPNGTCVRLKDIGLCSLALSNRTLSLRKLAGRARLQALGWLPPECFLGEGLGRASDVYAFGILMWECLTAQGFSLAPGKVSPSIATDGARLSFPEGTPEWYSSLAARCLAASARQRPSFRRIARHLAAVPQDQLDFAPPRPDAPAPPDAPPRPDAPAPPARPARPPAVGVGRSAG